ncbi:MAG: cation diffusion facilitator family transporter [Gemmatimonadota bacterium]|jgi:cation diffusion facilitator family transporter
MRRTRHAEIRRVLILTLLANIAVVAAKAVAGFMTGTLSVVAESAHSSVDALNNIIGLVLSRVAARAPDENHPYGHAKFETLGGLAVVVFLSITIYELSSSAIQRLITGAARPNATPVVFAVMAASAVVSFFVSYYERRKGRELASDILTADAAHTQSDIYASLAVIVGLAFVAAGYPRADAIFTLLVAAVIARASWRIIRVTVPVLVDEVAVDASKIQRTAQATPGVQAVYDVRSRGRRGEVFAELTIAVDPTLGVSEAHVIADAVEQRVSREIQAREVVVHVEPLGER